MLSKDCLPLLLWTLAGVGFTLTEQEMIICDNCGFPVGNATNSLGMLVDGCVRHAERHAEPRIAPPAYLNDTPTPAGGWFAARPRYDVPPAYLILVPGRPVVVESDPQEACVIAASLDPDGARVIGPVPVFADFTTPQPPAVGKYARGMLRALPPVGPITTAELDDIPSPRERELAAEDDARRAAEVPA